MGLSYALLVWTVVIKQLYKDMSSCANSKEVGVRDVFDGRSECGLTVSYRQIGVKHIILRGC
jgi:hypothetical protein